MNRSLSPAEQAFYISGFLAVLRRFRRATITGWIVTGCGVLFIPLGWSGGTPHGLLDLAASCAAIVAGIVLVEQSVGMLESYVRVPFHTPEPPEEPPPPTVQRLREIMVDVEQGGWHEAFAAIGQVEQLAADIATTQQEG